MVRTALFAFASAFACALVATPVRAADSAYTDLDLDACTTLEEATDEGSYVFMKCPGYGRYPVYFKEGDLRQATYFGFLEQRILDTAFETFGPFNHVSGKIEWRCDGNGTPFATILRYFIENGNPDTGMVDKSSEGQVLVVSRVGQPDDRQGCVVGYVDARANAKANDLARQIADDMARPFVCGIDKPVFHGNKSESSSQAVYNFPQANE